MLDAKAKVLYEEIYCARGNDELVHKGKQDLHQERSYLLPPFSCQPISSVFTFRSVCVTTQFAFKRVTGNQSGHRHF